VKLASLLAVLLLIPGAVWAASCVDCHTCPEPTNADPCLPECLREVRVPNWKDFDSMDSPKKVVLDQLVENYEPVVFDHFMHAEMSGMGGGNCRLCHHDNEGHAISSCGTCHAEEVRAGEVGINLKTAYHRQCMFCHREWSKETDCEICHAALNGHAPITAADALETPRDEAHAFIHRDLPQHLVFETDHKPGPYVTFNHDSHTKRYGLNCLECHVSDSCSDCHHPSEDRFAGALHSFSERSTCEQCHQMSTCSTCHARQPERLFSHELTGWSLGRYHQNLACDRCHGEPRVHKVMPRECNGCHNLWEHEDFDHAAMVGVDLGEEHEGFECSDCHQDAGYTTPPVCSNCHDDDRTAELLR